MVVLLLTQLTHAVTFAAQHAACITLVARYFPGRLRGRGQALYTTLGYGASGVIGGVAGGALIERWGYPGGVLGRQRRRRCCRRCACCARGTTPMRAAGGWLNSPTAAAASSRLIAVRRNGARASSHDGATPGGHVRLHSRRSQEPQTEQEAIARKHWIIGAAVALVVGIAAAVVVGRSKMQRGQGDKAAVTLEFVPREVVHPRCGTMPRADRVLRPAGGARTRRSCAPRPPARWWR